MSKTNMDGVRKSFVNILKHLKTVPLDEVRACIDVSIKVFEEEDGQCKP